MDIKQWSFPYPLHLTTDNKKKSVLKMGNKLEGKIAVITGATSDIGLATAKRFVSEGAYVFITGLYQKEMMKLYQRSVKTSAVFKVMYLI